MNESQHALFMFSCRKHTICSCFCYTDLRPVVLTDRPCPWPGCEPCLGITEADLDDEIERRKATGYYVWPKKV